MEIQKFSNYIVYVDESGDHSLASIDPDYPIFVLAFCIFNKQNYAKNISTAVQEFKFKYFGHDMVLLHEHEIRKAKNEFTMLVDADIRHSFMSGLNELILQTPFTVVSVVIEKTKLKEKYSDPANPYHIALAFGLERVYSFLRDNQQDEHRTHIICECRGKKEDKDLELAFRRVCDGANAWGPLPFEIIFADKKSNSCGLQLADLVARPIGRHVLDPHQENRAFDVVEKKIYSDRNGEKEGWGLKRFP